MRPFRITLVLAFCIFSKIHCQSQLGTLLGKLVKKELELNHRTLMMQQARRLFDVGGGNGGFTPAIYDAQGGPGKVVHGINLFTGQPSYSISLGGMNVRGVGFPISLGYSGSNRAMVKGSNDEFPTSWVGLGFSLVTPFVVVNHKGSYGTFDDFWYCNLGPYGGGQLLADSITGRFYVSTNPHIKVAFDTATSGEYAGQFTKWVFTFPDGKKMVFGEDTNAQRYVFYNKNLIKASPYAATPLPKFIYRWDLRTLYDTIPGRSPRNKIQFEYDRFKDTVFNNQAYIREGYVKNIKWLEGAQEVERYEFKTVAKGSNEYVGYSSSEPKDQPKLFETRRLDSLKCFTEGALDHYYKFVQRTQKKALLDTIKVYYPDLKSGAPVRDSGWTFTYNDSNSFYLLQSVTGPDAKVTAYNYTPMSFSGTDGDQDVHNYIMKRGDHISEIPLPSDTAKLALWNLSTSCDSRFCYMVVKDGDGDTLPGQFGIKQKMYVEIKRNLGNYFDTTGINASVSPADTITARFEVGNTTDSASNWDLFYGNNYVIVAGSASGTVKTYEFDGIRWAEKFPFAGDTRYSNGFGSRIKVVASGNYFLVQKMTTPSEVIVAVRKDNGWTSLNRNTASCQFTNKGVYGDSIRQAGSTKCFEWALDSLTLSLSSNYFTVLDQHTSIFSIYAVNANDSAFTNISTAFPVASAPSGVQIQKTGYNMNWEKQVVNVITAGDYMFIQSIDSYNGTNYPLYVHGFYFDGQVLKEVLYYPYSSISATPVSLYPGFGYFISANPSNGEILFWQLGKDGQGAPKYPTAGYQVRTDLNSSYYPIIRTSPSAFTVEYYSSAASMGLRPRASGTDYASYLYQVDRSLSQGFQDRSSNLVVSGGKKLFNLSFSPDNVMVGTHGINGSSLCDPSADVGPCTITYYSAPIHPEDLTNIVRPAEMQSFAYNSGWKSYKQAQDVMSNAERLMTRVTLDSTGGTRRIRYRHYQFDGKGYGTPDSVFVVSTVQTQAGLGFNRFNDITDYLFAPSPANTEAIEFNSNLLMPQFEAGYLMPIGDTLPSIGMLQTVFHLDLQYHPLSGKAMFLNGTEAYSGRVSNTGDSGVVQTVVNVPYRNPAWPRVLYVNRPKASYSNQIAKNGGILSDTTYYFNYCDSNSAPRFTLSVNRPQKILLQQNIFDSLGFAKQSMAYRLSSFPDTSQLKTWAGGTAYSNTGVINASKAVMSGYYAQEDSLWRERDDTLSDASLKAGIAPVFKLDENWLPASKITLRDSNNFFQVLESKVVKNKVSGPLGERYASYFYEGLRSDPVATVSNAKYANCAILLGENGNAGLAGGALDYRGKWSNPGATFSTSRAHTGRYSIKVVDNYGPTANDTLKDVRTLGFGYRVSAWIYSDTGTPVLAVERRLSNGTLQDITYGTPVSGSASTKKIWQRWEAKLNYVQLTNGSLFNGNNDYLRIWVGTGGPVGDNKKVIYVDDIVCVPSNANFSLSTYDKRGIATSTTSSNLIPVYYDLNPRGGVSAVRDDKYRIFGAVAGHKMGEN
jgi:hypothetical protein